MSCPCFIADVDVLDAFQDVDSGIGLQQCDEILTTPLHCIKAVIIEGATVEDLNRRVEVCEDPDVALEMIELHRFTCITSCDGHTEGMIVLFVYARSEVEFESTVGWLEFVNNCVFIQFTGNGD